MILNLLISTLYNYGKYYILYKMERLVEVMLKKVHILAILDCYYRLSPFRYISYDFEGITIQGSCEERRVLATMVIPQNSLEGYECHEPLVVAIPYFLKKLGGRCVSISIV